MLSYNVFALTEYTLQSFPADLLLSVTRLKGDNGLCFYARTQVESEVWIEPVPKGLFLSYGFE